MEDVKNVDGLICIAGSKDMLTNVSLSLFVQNHLQISSFSSISLRISPHISLYVYDDVLLDGLLVYDSSVGFIDKNLRQ
jgi:hypothetical protein